MKLLYYILLSCVAGIGIVAIWILRQYPGIHDIDTAGHIASSVLLGQGGLHTFNDNRFMGFVQNLFYPPAEDIFVYITHLLTGLSPLPAFQLYISIITALYLWSLARIATTLKHNISRCIYILLIIVFLFLSKINLTHFQGLGLLDLLFTGLTSEFLGAIGLLGLIYELLAKKRDRVIILFLILAIASHIIIGPIALCIYAFYIVFAKSWKKIWIVFAALAITAFVRLPFLLSLGFSSHSQITQVVPSFLLALPIFLLVSRQIKSPVHKSFLATTILILLPVSLIFITSNNNLLPPFHYYRFATVGLLLFFISISYIFDELTDQKKNHLAQGLLVVIIVFFLHHFRLDNFEHYIGLLKPADKVSNYSQHVPSGSGRIWLLDSSRSIDFHTDSMMTAYHPNLQFVKGLYWESNQQNEILNSYIANLINNENIVTSFAQKFILKCGEYNQVLDHFIRQYAISDIYTVDESKIPFSVPLLQICFSNALKEGTTGYNFTAGNTIHYNSTDFTHISISPKANYEDPNTLIVPYTAEEKDTIHLPTTGNNTILFYNVIANSTGKQIVGLLPNIDYPEARFTNRDNLSGLRMQKIGNGKYSIDVPSTRDTTFIIKLYYYPGWQLINENGQALELKPIIGGMISSAHGKLVLEYHRPWYIYLSYIISILSGLGVILYIARNKNKKQ